MAKAIAEASSTRGPRLTVSRSIFWSLMMDDPLIASGLNHLGLTRTWRASGSATAITLIWSNGQFLNRPMQMTQMIPRLQIQPRMRQQCNDSFVPCLEPDTRNGSASTGILPQLRCNLLLSSPFHSPKPSQPVSDPGQKSGPRGTAQSFKMATIKKKKTEWSKRQSPSYQEGHYKKKKPDFAEHEFVCTFLASGLDSVSQQSSFIRLFSPQFSEVFGRQRLLPGHFHQDLHDGGQHAPCWGAHELFSEKECWKKHTHTN